MKSSKKLIIFCSSSLSKINGQNIVTKKILEILSNEFRLIKLSYEEGFGLQIVYYFIRLIKLYLKVFKDKPDFVYLVCSRSFFGFIRDIPILFLSKFGLRLIVHIHGSDFKNLFINKYISSLSKFLYQNCEILIPSIHLKKDIEQYFINNIYVCENFIDNDLSLYKQENNLLTINNNVFKVLWNSNIISSKGFFETCEAINYMNKKGYKVIFTVLGQPCGDSELSKNDVIKKLDSYATKKWLDRRFLVERIHLKEILLNTNAVILPSSYPSECQPLSIIEGMVFCKHIIINNTKALNSTIGKYPSELVKREKLSIANALEACIKNDSDSIYKRLDGGNNAVKRFSYALFESNIKHIFSIN